MAGTNNTNSQITIDAGDDLLTNHSPPKPTDIFILQLSKPSLTTGKTLSVDNEFRLQKKKEKLENPNLASKLFV